MSEVGELETLELARKSDDAQAGSADLDRARLERPRAHARLGPVSGSSAPGLAKGRSRGAPGTVAERFSALRSTSAEAS